MTTESDNKILGISRTALSAFIAGTAIVLWMINVIFSPIGSIKTDIALIQKDISNINSNHEAHIQDLAQTIKELKVEQINQQAQIIDLQKQILVLLQKK